MPRKKDPVVIYGQRCETLADLATCIDNMRIRAGQCSTAPSSVIVNSYVKLEQDANGELAVYFADED